MRLEGKDYIAKDGDILNSVSTRDHIFILKYTKIVKIIK